MLIKTLRENPVDYAHVISAMEFPKKLVVSKFADALIIHCTVSNVYVVEYSGDNLDDFCNMLKKLKITRLQTSNKEIYKRLIPFFKHNYICKQAVYENQENYSPEEFEFLHSDDLLYIQESYGMQDYIRQLFERNRLFGWYEKNVLKGYVAFHIDETVGALFVKPEYRNEGIGSKLMKAALCRYSKDFPGKTVYTQILTENEKSIKLHEKIGCSISSPVYWVYNKEYEYNS